MHQKLVDGGKLPAMTDHMMAPFMLGHDKFRHAVHWSCAVPKYPFVKRRTNKSKSYSTKEALEWTRQVTPSKLATPTIHSNLDSIVAFFCEACQFTPHTSSIQSFPYIHTASTPQSWTHPQQLHPPFKACVVRAQDTCRSRIMA